MGHLIATVPGATTAGTNIAVNTPKPIWKIGHGILVRLSDGTNAGSIIELTPSDIVIVDDHTIQLNIDTTALDLLLLDVIYYDEYERY